MYKLLLSALSLFIVVGCFESKPYEEDNFQQKPDTLHYEYNTERSIIEKKITIGYSSDCNFDDFAKKQYSTETNPK